VRGVERVSVAAGINATASIDRAAVLERAGARSSGVVAHRDEVEGKVPARHHQAARAEERKGACSR
jgi:hypothetical protein